MIHWLWLLPAAEFGLFVGVLLRGWCTRGKSTGLRNRNSVLYGALYSLARAVEDYPRLTGAHNRVLDKAMSEAREVLE